MKPRKPTPLMISVMRTMQGGPITSAQLQYRLGYHPADFIWSLERRKFIELKGDEYHLTDAGRAAIPARNPVIAKRRQERGLGANCEQ